MIVMTTDIWHRIGQLAVSMYGRADSASIELIIKHIDNLLLHESVENIELRTFIIKRGSGYILSDSKLMYHDPENIIAVIIPRDEYNRRLSAEKEAELWPV